MYSKKSWGGPVDPYILAKFKKADKDAPGDPSVGIVIWEFQDYDFIWKPDEDDENVSSMLVKNSTEYEI
jgi:hypothetical protein